MSATEKPSVFIEALCQFFAPSPNWWFEASIDDPDDEVIHTDGMYTSVDEALEAGEVWAAAHGYVVREIDP